MKKTMKYVSFGLFLSLCCSQISVATPSILDDPHNSIHQKVAEFNARPNIVTLKEINDMGKIANFDAAEITVSRGEGLDLHSPFQTMAKIVIEAIDNCFCPLEYVNFPLFEEQYRQTILFFSIFPVDFLESEDHDEVVQKNKLSHICSLYWTMGSLDSEIRKAIETIEEKYELQITKVDFNELMYEHVSATNYHFSPLFRAGFELIPAAFMYGVCKIWANKSARYAVCVGLASCVMGSLYITATRS
jgi:hypothetical protein